MSLVEKFRVFSSVDMSERKSSYCSKKVSNNIVEVLLFCISLF